MSEWTNSERVAIKDTFAKIDSEVVGPAAVSRFLIVYPWTQRYFGNIGNLSNADAIKSNPNVIAQGKVVLDDLARAAQNLDNTKATYVKPNVMQKLKVDPGNFRLLTNSITVEVATQMGKDFTPEVHAAVQKFMDVTVSAPGKQKH